MCHADTVAAGTDAFVAGVIACFGAGETDGVTAEELIG
jgi:hypothetical protein